ADAPCSTQSPRFRGATAALLPSSALERAGNHPFFSPPASGRGRGWANGGCPREAPAWPRPHRHFDPGPSRTLRTFVTFAPASPPVHGNQHLFSPPARGRSRGWANGVSQTAQRRRFRKRTLGVVNFVNFINPGDDTATNGKCDICDVNPD